MKSTHEPVIDLELLKQAVMYSREGISIADARQPDMPLIFVNPAFERLTGFSAAEVLGHNCRFLRADDMPSAQRERLRQSLWRGEGFIEVLPNRRRNGESFWNELSLSPIRAMDGSVTHFIGFQKDVSNRVTSDRRLKEQNANLEKARKSLEELATIDALTHVYNRRHFDSRLDTLWKISARSREPMALFFIDIDDFKAFNDYYGHLVGDEALVTVAQALADSFKRGSDFLARYGGEEFVVVACGMTEAEASVFAEELCTRIRDLDIDNPDARHNRLTVSIGYSVVTPGPNTKSRYALELADRALYRAKDAGRNCALGAEASKD